MIINTTYELFQIKHDNRNNRPLSINKMFKDMEHYINYTKFKNNIQQLNLDLDKQEVEEIAFKNFIRYNDF